MLATLTYVSRALIGAQSADMLGLARQCFRNNPALDVTGALYFDGLEFLQTIEGPSAAVDRLFDVIRADDRHCAVRLLLRRPIETRRFGDWDMKMVEGVRFLHLRRFFDYDRVCAADPQEVERRVELLARL